MSETAPTHINEDTYQGRHTVWGPGIRYRVSVRRAEELGEDEEGGLSIEGLCPDHNAEPKHECED